MSRLAQQSGGLPDDPNPAFYTPFLNYELRAAIRFFMSNVGRQLVLVGHSRGQFRVARICPFLSRTVNRNLEPPDPLAEPRDRPQNGPSPAFYTQL